MSNGPVLTDDHELDPRLQFAVDAVRASVPPPEACSRVIARARQLRPRQRSWPVRLAMPVTAAAILVGAVAFWLGTADLLADVAAAVAERPWLHGVATNAEGGSQQEFWYSAQEGIMATRQDSTVLFLDQKQGVMDLWSGGSNADDVIVRKPLDAAQQRLFQTARDGLRALLMGDLQGVASSKNERIVSHSRQREQVDGQEQIIHRLVVETADDSTVQTLTLAVDPQSDLPQWYELQLQDERLRFDLSYPEQGPYTIYGVRVPRTAKVQTQRPSDDLERVLAAMKRARTKFDAYRGLTISAVKSADPRDGGGGIFDATAHQGTKWRVDRLRIPASWMIRARVPDEQDPAHWWLEQISQFGNHPTLISDGSQQWLFTAVRADPPREDPENPGLVKIESLKRQNRGALYPADDPSPYSMHELPHFVGYHDGYATDMMRTATVIANPPSGPENTILVEVRQVNGEAGQRFWVDPARSYLVVRREYLRNHNGVLRTDGVLEVVQSAVSPQGFWYPTVVRSPDSSIHMETGVRSDSYTRFYLDFDAELPDKLFDADKAAME